MLMGKFNKSYIFIFIFAITIIFGINPETYNDQKIENNPKDNQIQENGIAINSLKNKNRVPLPESISSKISDLHNIKDIKNFNFTFTNNSIGFSFLFNQTRENQVIYLFLKANSTIKDSISLFAINSQNEFLENISFSYFGEKNPSNLEIYGRFEFPSRTNNWLIMINYTDSFINSTFTEIEIYIPDKGYDFNSGIQILDNTSKYTYSVNFPFETIFWEINLEKNRRVAFEIKDELNNLVLNDAIEFYGYDSINNKPGRLPDRPSEDDGGVFKHSWVSGSTELKSNVLWIKIKLLAGIKGNLVLTFDFQNEGYSFNTAIPFELNSTNIVYQNYPERYSQHQFFKITINENDVKIFLLAFSDDPLVLRFSIIKIYYETEENLLITIQERFDSIVTGTYNFSFVATIPGDYYIEYQSDARPQIGTFYIEITYNKLPQFIWKLEIILINLILLILFPIIRIYYIAKDNPHNILEWEINENQKAIFHTLSKNNRLNPKMEVPNEKILLVRNSLLIWEIIIDIIPLDDDSSSIGFRYKKLFSISIPILLILILLVYWMINIVWFVFFQETMLPFRVSELGTINEIILFIIIIILLLSSILYFIKENTVNQIKNEIELSINELNQKKSLNIVSNKSIDIESIKKNLAYIRVLWSQADKAFKNQNYSLFIIRADNAVKKLLEIRFQQLVGKIDEKLDFTSIIEIIRNNGFDIPSTKNIEKFRKIRNKVVHSSHLLDEKTAIETFAYYSKFLTRMGLRT